MTTSTTGWTLLSTAAAFKAAYDRSDNKLIVFYFTQDNCPPCNIIAPLLAPWKTASAYSGCLFYEINESHYSNVPSDIEFSEITSFPAMKFYKNYENTDDGYIKFLHNSSVPLTMYSQAETFINANKS
ncbi:hypothetical protein CYY_002363 [Polysphondylium violaceum]|uniref:Thioredoxin domain-containing protein n=1 Tax=Polysphondylium violaceum TaxID=133409 RepID=A0A8J4V6Y7_9MYCE|nr:hypothetical protein CYY_002363 [Polysphondylium violaceum]